MKAVIGLGHSPSLRRMEARARKAIEVFEDGADVLIFTGGYVQRVHEAQYMRNVASHVPDEKVVLEPNAHSTLQNAEYSYEILKQLGCDDRYIALSDTACQDDLPQDDARCQS